MIGFEQWGRLTLRFLSIALALFFSINVSAATVTVQVFFQNGDQLTGELQRADASGVEFRPNVAGLGSRMRLAWQGDAIATLHLKAGSGPGSACVYVSETRQTSKMSRLAGGKLCFNSAVVTKQQGTDHALRLVAHAPAPKGDVNYLWIQSVETIAPAPPAVTAVTPTATSATRAAQLPSIWALNINAPESIVQGTQSQQQFGGLFRTDLYAGDENHFAFAAAGTHQHNLSLHKPPQRTDTFDSFGQYSRTNTKEYGVYVIGEWFLNTSLGMAAERSGGAGVLFPGLYSKSGDLYANAWLDFRYFNERLYSGRELKLAGSVVHGEIVYSPSNAPWFITFGTALKPMFNVWGASQASGSVTFTVPIHNHVCITVTPADDTYIGNSPSGFRRNYLKSSVGLQILAGSNPAQKCK
jgi:hypothetical protein